MSKDRRGSPINPPTSPETLAETRRLYETTELALAEIGARVGLHRATVCRFAKRDGWLRPAAAAARRALVGSIRQRVEREIGAAERVIGSNDALGPEAERAARTLASLVRTLRELARFDEEARAAEVSRAARETVEDEPIADLDAFRDALADRLERLLAEREG